MNSSKAYEFVCEEEIKFRAKSIFALWKENNTNNQAPVQKMLNLYTLIIENEYQVSDESIDFLLRKLLRYLEIFFDSHLLENPTDYQMKFVKNACVNLISAHNHFDLLALYWESFFFSHEFTHQKYSEDLFHEFPQLPRYLDYDRLLDKAEIYGKGTFINHVDKYFQ